MNKVSKILVLALGYLLAHSSASAQDETVAQLRKEIDVLVVALREGLDLGSAPGFLGINATRLQSLYLQNQGVVIEIRTPLASQRTRVSLSTLASSISRRSSRVNPFSAIVLERNESASGQSSVRAQETEAALAASDQASEESRARDLERMVEDAIREAVMRVRMLGDIGTLDDTELPTLEQTLDALQGELRELGQLTNQLRQRGSTAIAARQADGGNTGGATTDSAIGSWTELEAALTALQERAGQQLEYLNEQYAEAREQYQAHWQEEVQTLETNLYGLLCDFGATLENLPEDEYLTLVLAGLGEEREQGAPGNKIHVLAKQDLGACQSGQINAQTLQLRASTYSY